MSDRNAIVYLASDDPDASYREVVELLLGVWARAIPEPLVARIAAAFGPWRGAEGEEVDPLQDGGTTGVVVPASLLDPSLSGEAGIQVSCRPVWAQAQEPDAPPERIGRAIDVLLHPVPTLGGPDLSGVVTLTALAMALGGARVDRPGWAWAIEIPGTSWVIGRPEHPAVAYGLGASEEALPTKTTAARAWRKREDARLARAAASLEGTHR